MHAQAHTTYIDKHVLEHCQTLNFLQIIVINSRAIARSITCYQLGTKIRNRRRKSGTHHPFVYVSIWTSCVCTVHSNYMDAFFHTRTLHTDTMKKKKQHILATSSISGSIEWYVTSHNFYFIEQQYHIII